MQHTAALVQYVGSGPSDYWQPLKDIILFEQYSFD